MKIIHPFDIDLSSEQQRKWWSIVGMDWTWFELSEEDNREHERICKKRDYSRRRSKVIRATGDALIGNIHGYAAEKCCAYLLTRSVNQVSTLSNRNCPDIGEDIECKSTIYEERWKIFVQDVSKHLDRRYVLFATYLWPKYVGAIGWAFGHEINRPAKLSSQNGERQETTWLPWNLLHKMEDLGI